jgi:TolA-binding protein
VNHSFENLGHLRTGQLAPLVDFYTQQHDLFARWARRHFGTTSETAHSVLREVLLDFYDRALDGRVARWPSNLREHLYTSARQLLTATTTNTVQAPDAPLPASEAQRRQLLLRVFSEQGASCRQVLLYFYMNNYRLDKLAGKMGFANANVARMQKSDCLRKLHESLARANAPGTAELLPYLPDVERAFDELFSESEQEAFSERMAHDATLRQACLTYEQYAADLRWAAGRDTLQRQLEAFDRLSSQRAAAHIRIKQRQRQQQFRWLRWVALAAVVAALVVLGIRLLKPRGSWEDFDVQDPGLAATAVAGRPLLAQAMEQYRAGDHGSALRTLRRVSPVHIGQDTFLYYSGLMLLRQGEARYAESYFQRVSESPGSQLRGKAAFYLGLSHWQQQELKQAKAALQQAAAEAPSPYRETSERALHKSRW